MTSPFPMADAQGLDSTIGLGLSDLLNPVNTITGDTANPVAAAAPATASTLPDGNLVNLDGLCPVQRAEVLLQLCRTQQARLQNEHLALQLDASRRGLPTSGTGSSSAADAASRRRARDQDSTDNSRRWCNADSSRVMGKEASCQLMNKGYAEYNALVFASEHPERMEHVYQHAREDAIARAEDTQIYNDEDFHDYFNAGKPPKMGKAKDKAKLGGLDCFKSSYNGLLAKTVSEAVQVFFALVTQEANNNMKRKTLAKNAEFGEYGFMAVSEVADRQSFVLSAAVMFDRDIVNKDKTGFKPDARAVELTKEQLAIVAFKISNRLCDPLLDGTNRGGSHVSSIQQMLVKLEARLATMPCTAIKIVSPEPVAGPAAE